LQRNHQENHAVGETTANKNSEEKMKSYSHHQAEIENIVSLCCGNPHEEELPQVAAESDILADIYSDILNVPREYAVGHFNHQYDLDEGFDSLIH
jgi:hypothetical protein